MESFTALNIAATAGHLGITRARYSVARNRVNCFPLRLTGRLISVADGVAVIEAGAKNVRTSYPMPRITAEGVDFGAILARRAETLIGTSIQFVVSNDPKTSQSRLRWMRPNRPIKLDGVLRQDPTSLTITGLDVIIADPYLLKLSRAHRRLTGPVVATSIENLPKPGVTKSPEDRLGEDLKPGQYWGQKGHIAIKVKRDANHRSGEDVARTDLLSDPNVSTEFARATACVGGAPVTLKMAEENRPQGDVFRTAMAVLPTEDLPADFDAAIVTVADLARALRYHALYNVLFAKTADFTNSGVGIFLEVVPHEYNEGRWVVRLDVGPGHDGTYRQDGIEEITTEWVTDSRFGLELLGRLQAIEPGTQIRFFASLDKMKGVGEGARSLTHYWNEARP